MRIIIDICHPAHVHFFYEPYLKLINNNHEVFIASRDKDVTLDLLKEKNISNSCLSKSSGKASIISLLSELVIHEVNLLKAVKSFKPDIITAIGGIFAAHIAKLTGTKSIVFYDTENAKLQNLLTYPFTSKLIVPDCYSGWTPKNKTDRYSGYHELSYLHPSYFKPNRKIAYQNGIKQGTRNIFIRIVSWCANHDLTDTGWSDEFLGAIINSLGDDCNIIISSERSLPKEYDKYSYRGNASDMHHILGFCDLYIGESATIASEAVVLGVPSIYIAQTSRGYVDEQQSKYHLLDNISSFDIDKVKTSLNRFLSMEKDYVSKLHQDLLDNTIDVAEMVYANLTRSE